MTKDGSKSVTLQARIYTDIEDETFLSLAKSVIEDIWRAEEGSVQYAIRIEFRKVKLKDPPQDGEHLDMDKHLARFPKDGGVLTTGAQFTYGSVGRAVVLGPEPLIPAQRIVLNLQDRRLTLATDGLGPFEVTSE